MNIIVFSKDRYFIFISLDRIDSNKGYIENNIQWVVKEINFMKNNLTEKEFFILCNSVSNFKKYNKI